ncbi:MAG: glycosyltransferase family 2 protein, partial [Lachnospiraceae bacterium]|nr:glycosyltransferase family 2 protein [Lachnospiraceae bacterium]
MQIKVSVIIPNFNGKEYLENCMDSLMRQDVRSFEVIVIDDASSDDSLLRVKEKYPENGAFPRTRYAVHEENKGFCCTVNDGVALAEAPYVILLNNDTVVEPSFVKELYYAIRRYEKLSDRKKIFSVQAKMMSMQEKEIIDDAGDYYCALGWAYAAGKGKPASNYEKERKIFAACGGAAIYKKEILQMLGGFDENHFAYLEDIDIGYRAKLYGYENLFTPNAIVYHAGSAASGSRYNQFKERYNASNSIYIIYKNMPNWQIIVNLPLFVIGYSL